jgi:hypothetical protein
MTRSEEETIEELRMIRPELERIAESDVPFSEDAERALRRLN